MYVTTSTPERPRQRGGILQAFNLPDKPKLRLFIKIFIQL